MPTESSARPLRLPYVMTAAIALSWILALAASSDAGGVLGRLPFSIFLVLVVLTLGGAAFGYLSGAADAAEQRRRQFRLLAAAIAAALAIVCCELPAALGPLDYRVLFQTDGVSSLYNPRYRLDPELIGIRYPHDRFQGQAAGDLVHRLFIDTDHKYDADVRWDHNGFRNAHDLDRADVALIGDSFLEAALVPWGETVTARLAERLDRTVLNLGQGGYGPQQELVVLRRFGLPAEPRAVVWFFYEGNDLANCLTYDAIQESWDRWAADQHGWYQRSFLRNSVLGLSNALCRKSGNPQLAASRRGTLQASGDHQGEDIYFGYRCAPQSAGEESAVITVERAWTRAAAWCRERDVRFVVAFVPVKWRVYHGLVKVDPDSDLAQWKLTGLNTRLQRVAREAGAEWVDLTGPLADAAREGQLVYFPDDAHWTAAGHAVVAEAVARVLETDE